MVDKPQTAEQKSTDTPGASAAPATPAPRRSPGHRGQDVRDTVAEMAARAQEISQEAGSKMAAAMKDVIGAAAGLTTFALESARDLVQYMVRRGQMTQEEADKLIREAEAAASKRRPVAPVEVRAAPSRPEAPPRHLEAAPPASPKAPPPKAAAPKREAKQPAAKKAPAKPAKKAAAKKSATKAPAKKKAATRTKRPTKTAAKKKR